MDQVIIITGASRGIGAATAVLAAERGYGVCVNYRSSADEAAQVLARIEKSGGTAFAVRANVSIESEVIELFKKVTNEMGPVSALCFSSAAAYPKKSPAQFCGCCRMKRRMRPALCWMLPAEMSHGDARKRAGRSSTWQATRCLP
jgi:NAD(P)-dependent dehydrogenase (short-subunit alcohol dehydrogenase family)